MNHPMPTAAHLRKARKDFLSIEPRGFFYRSIIKLVNAVLNEKKRTDTVEELVCVLMMLLTTWNKNYYRFFKQRKPGMPLEEHFSELEDAISKHFKRLIRFRNQRLHETIEIPEQTIRDVFNDFSDVLGRVGAAKCLHLIAPNFFPLWDAAILKNYNLEKAPYRRVTDAERYVAFMRISKAQIERLGDFGSFTKNPLKSLDEYNYCRFTKNIPYK